MSKLVLVTGSSGFIGSQIVNKFLTNKNIKVLGVARDFPIKPKTKNKLNIQQILKDPNLKDYDNIQIFHTASHSSYINNDIREIEKSIEFSREILDMFMEIKKINSKTFLLHTSTIGILELTKNDIKNKRDFSKNGYVKSKKLIEEFYEKENQIVNVRLGWVFGSDMRKDSHIRWIIDQSLKNSIWTKFYWPGVINPIFIEDLVHILTLIMDKFVMDKTKLEFEKIYITSTQEISFSSLIRLAKGKENNIKILQKRLSSLDKIELLPRKLRGLVGTYYLRPPSRIVTDLHKDFSDTYSQLNKLIKQIKVKKVLITGGSSGLGLALAKIHIGAGDLVTILDKNNVDPNLENDVIFIKEDLSREIDLTKHDFEQFDVIYLNAGSATKESFIQKNKKKILHELNVNIVNNIIFLKFFLGLKGKKLVVISSISKYFATPGLEIYSASKSFLSKISSDLMFNPSTNQNKILLFEVSGMNTNFQRQAGVKKRDNSLLEPSQVASKIYIDVLRDKTFKIKTIGNKGKILKLLFRILPTTTYLKLTSFLFNNFR